MRSVGFLVFLIFWPGLIFARGASVDSSEQPGVILIRLSPALSGSLDSAFSRVRPSSDPVFSHTDIHGTFLTGDSSIENLIGLPSALHRLRLKPFVPTHSVAFEDIRERSNRSLFSNEPRVAGASNNESALRSAEDKISRWFALYYSDSIVGYRAAALVRKSSYVELAEPKYYRHTCYTPNDSLIGQQYSLTAIDAFDAWNVVRCDSTMIVADADIGTDWTHEDLAASIYNNPGEIGIDSNGNDKRSNGIDDDHNGFIDDWHGWDFGGTYGNTPDNDARPGGGIDHGTQTGGILAATGNNQIGIAGVAYGARLIPIKISDDGGGNLTFGFEGIIYAADMQAKVVNCSWGGPSYSDAEQDAIDYAYAKDCSVVAACGNNGNDYAYQDFFPAAYNHVLSVAADDQNGNIASFSNYNTHVDVSAPGVEIMSTIPGNGYLSGGQSGTSFASPNTAGVVALVRQRFPEMTAGQAMEQVRVTANPVFSVWNNVTGIVTPDDSSRIDYEGHGAVDAFRAVTDTNTFSARIETFTLDDNNGTGAFAPGESGGVVLYVRNYLKPLNQLMAKLQVVNGGGYVTLQQTTVPFGAAGTMQIVENLQSAFQISVADNVPPNTKVTFRVFFYDSTAGYQPDYDYFSFVINPSYLDLNANNLDVTFAGKGSIGYDDVLVNTEGSGFRWQKAPVSISPYGISQLFQGGLMAGTDSTHIVDVVEGLDGNYGDEDFSPETNIHYVQPDRPNAAQELASYFSDSLADSASQAGLRVNCNAYAYTQGLAANAIVAKYVFRLRSSSVAAALSAALYIDWDIGLDGSINVTYFDSSTSTAASYRLQPDYPYIGMRLLSVIPEGAELNYHAIMNDGSQGDINTYGPFTHAQKWTAMNEFYPSVGPGDISLSFGLKNMPMRPDDSVEMTVAIALAENDSVLNQTLDETAQLWFGTASVNSVIENSPAVLEVFPNPFSDKLHITWSLPEQNNGGNLPAHITIYDELGRRVVSDDIYGSQYEFAPSESAHGFYIVDVMAGGIHLRREIVSSGQ